jgi:transglutaminase-like putative cysteine protease
MESDPVGSATIFPAFRPKSIAWWGFWLLLSIQMAVILIIFAKTIPNSDMVSISVMCISAALMGWFLPSSGKKKWICPATLLVSVFVIILIQSHGLTNILNSYSLLIIGISEQSNSSSFAFHISTALQSIWLFVMEIAKEVPHLLVSFKSQAILFQFSWTLFLWTCFVATSFLVRNKYHALIAFIPILLFIVLSTLVTNLKSVTIISTLSIMLVSCILLELVKKEIHWRNSGVDYSPEIRFDTFTLSVPIIIITIIFAGLIPEIDLNDIQRKWDELTGRKEDVTSHYESDVINNEQVNSPGVSNPQIGVMPRSHLLGSGPDLSTREVMTFQTNEATFTPGSNQLQEPSRYYLTGSIYDYYTGKGWLTSRIISTEIQPNGLINTFPTEEYRLILQTIEKNDIAPDSVFLTGSVISVNVPIEAYYRSENDLFSAVADAKIFSGYSLIALPSENELRGDQEPIPLWIMERYTQLPDTLPDRTRKLALAITYDQETSYDKALSIQSYLRRFPYSLDIPQPPENDDVIDYFLFDLQKGYCDYFASAMVVMARAIGIPARLAVGYTSGKYDFDANYYIITEENAHAWPELYFSSSGWITFEPTSNLPIVDVAQDNIESTPFQSEDLPEIAPPETNSSRSITYLLLTLGIFVIFFSVWFFIKYRKTAPDHTLTRGQAKIIRSFKTIVERSKYLGIKYQASMTSLEFLDSFRTNIYQKHPPTKSSAYQVAAIDLLDQFVKLYNMSLFRDYAPLEVSTKESNTLVSKVNKYLLLLMLSRRSWN